VRFAADEKKRRTRGDQMRRLKKYVFPQNSRENVSHGRMDKYINGYTVRGDRSGRNIRGLSAPAAQQDKTAGRSELPHRRNKEHALKRFRSSRQAP
jgi:hypothetical protein